MDGCAESNNSRRADAPDGEIKKENATPDASRSPDLEANITESAAGATGPSPKRHKVDDATLNDVLQLVTDISPEVFAGVKKHRRKVLTARMINMAWGWGMSEVRDIAIFCVLYRYPGTVFFKRPAWLDAAERVKNGQITWSMAFGEPQLWEEPEQEKRG